MGLGLIRALSGGLMLLCLGPVLAATAPDDEAPAARALLEKALAYYHEQGDQAFAAFSRQGEFVDQDRYVFVVDTHGVMLASGGPSSALIGRDVSEVLGADLRKAFKAALTTPDNGAIQEAEYRWQNWKDGKVERKRVFYQRVGERILAVGYYLPRASAQEARAFLDRAVTELGRNRQVLLDEINASPGGFLQDDLYVFVVDLKTRRYLAHGTNQRLLDTDFGKVRDPDGKPVGEPILALMNKQEEGEYEYRWKNPVTGKVENKHTYLKRVGQLLLAVGYYRP